MAIKVASGSWTSIERILSEIAQPDIKAVIYFFSPDIGQHGIHQKMKAAFRQACCIGASMIGGWSTSGAVESGLVAMTLSGDEVAETFVAFREGVKADPRKAAQGILADLRKSLGSRQLNPDEYVGIVLFDGLCLGEEIIREFTMEKDFVVPLVGGAAADNLEFKKTFVGCNDSLSTDGVTVMVLRMKVPFFYDHYVHYQPTQVSCIVTKSEPARRIVWEIDGKPAAAQYAKLLGLQSVDKLQHAHFARNPLGVLIGDTVYTRSPNAVIDGTGLQFYCYIEAGTKVNILKQGNIIENAQKGLANVRTYLPEIGGAILFNCVLRYLEMKEENKIEAFNAVFQDMPFVGFNTFGEELFTHHNQTLTALFIGKAQESTCVPQT
jgi:hypothetical protein